MEDWEGSRHRIQANYDRQSAWYDAITRGERNLVDRGLAALGVRSGERVLEIGCGTGYAMRRLAQRHDPAALTCGIDLSMEMLKAARSKLRRSGMVHGVALLHGDALALPFAAGAFEAIFISFTLELLSGDEMSVVLSECRRVLDPHGRIAVISLAVRDKRTLMAGLYAWAHRVLPDYVDCRFIDVQAALQNAGYTVATALHTSTWGLPVDILLAGPQ